jgi:CheY-like chemotaxis protein
MALRTCLLVTDDPDDHQAISEAVSQISEKTIVLNILDSQKALMLLKESDCQPDYLFLDLSMHGIRINTLLKTIKDDDGMPKMPTVVYGLDDTFTQIEDTRHLIFFNKDYEYSSLKDFLLTILKPQR